MITLILTMDGLVWQSDWNGDEVGFDEIEIVGLYQKTLETGTCINFYIDMNGGHVLDMWIDDDEEEN